MSRSVLAFLMILSTMVLSPVGAQSTDNYPSRRITIVLPFAAGGPSDIVARVVGAKMSETLGQPIIIDNRVGAGGSIGTAYAARAEPNGYTLMVGNPGTHATSPLVQRSAGYDPVTDFSFIAPLGSSTFVLICNPKIPVKTAPELIDHMKKSPGKLTYGSAGTGSNVHFIFEYFKHRAGVNLVHVPYKGAAPMVADLLAGAIDCTFDASSKQNIETGRLRAFAVASIIRDTLYPNVPTLDESGLKGFNLTSWQALMAPKGVSEAIIAKLNHAANLAVRENSVIEKLAATGFHARGGSSEDLRRQVATDSSLYRDVARDANIQLQ